MGSANERRWNVESMGYSKVVKCLCGNSMYKTGDFNPEGFDEVWECMSTPRCRVLCFSKHNGFEVKYRIRQGATKVADGPHKIGWCLVVWDELAL